MAGEARQPRGCSTELEARMADTECESGCAEEWEFRELRGFAMRRGRRGRILRMARALAARGRPRAPWAERPGVESSLLVMPGRNLFSRRAGNNHHVARCSLCHPGRHHGHGGKKASKKVHTWGDAREKWLEVLREVREAERAGIAGGAEPAAEPSEADGPQPSDPPPPMRAQGGRAVVAGSGQEAEAWQPPPPVAIARARTRTAGRRRGRARCACCPAGRGGGAADDTGSPLPADFVLLGSEADSGEWTVV